MLPFYLNDSSGSTWLIGITNLRQITRAPAAFVPSAPTSVNLIDTGTRATVALSVVPVTGQFQIAASSGPGIGGILLQSPNASLWLVVVANGIIGVVTILPSTALAGPGTALQYSLDGVNYTKVAQLRKISPAGSKQTIVDQTNILTPPTGDAPLPVRVSAGEIDIDGVLSPQDVSQLTLGQIHAARSIVVWRLTFSDGVTVWTFLGSVSEYKPFDISVSKAYIFAAKLRVSGPYTGPLGVA